MTFFGCFGVGRSLGVVARAIGMAALFIGLAGVVSTARALPVDISLDPTESYLHTDEDPAALDAPAIDLAALGILAGDSIRLTRLGDYAVSIGGGDTVRWLLGVFSTSATLLGGAASHRVPGAIEAGPDLGTGLTFSNGEPTDIPEDFLIGNGDGSINDLVIEVPTGALFLFVAAPDSFYGDNSDLNGNFALRIEKMGGGNAEQIPEPPALLLLAAGLAGATLLSRRRRAVSRP